MQTPKIILAGLLMASVAVAASAEGRSPRNAPYPRAHTGAGLGGTGRFTDPLLNTGQVLPLQRGEAVLPAGQLTITIPLSPALAPATYGVVASPVTTHFAVSISTQRTTSFDILVEWNDPGVRVKWAVVP